MGLGDALGSLWPAVGGVRDAGRELQFVNADMFDVSLESSTVIFVNSAVFVKATILRLVAKLELEVSPGTRILSTKELLPQHGTKRLVPAKLRAPLQPRTRTKSDGDDDAFDGSSPLHSAFAVHSSWAEDTRVFVYDAV